MSDETCGNGLDDDKNGVIDEGCPCEKGTTQPCFVGDAAQAGKGVCGYGKQSCLVTGGGEVEGAYWGECEGSGVPQQETCNNTDDDCNGTVDDGCACVEGETRGCNSACGGGQQLCEGGAWGPCTAPQPATEVCDGGDNDCDGQVDEELQKPCSTACGSGVQLCASGAWGACSAPTECGTPCGSGLVCKGQCCEVGGKCCPDGACPDAQGNCKATCNGKQCGTLCCVGALICCPGDSCPIPFLNICPGSCSTVECKGTCCPGGNACCPDGSCPDASGACKPSCSTVQCGGKCCPGGKACCPDGSCPDASGACKPACATVVCDGVCCPKGGACCPNGACPDPTTGQCSAELDQCAGKPVAELYAHSPYTLYRVDPDTNSVTTVGGLDCGGQVIDIAIDKGGVMYGTTPSSVVKIDKQTAKCQVIAEGAFPNSLSFVPEGKIGSSEALVGYNTGQYVTIDKTTGKVTNLGQLPSGYSSSGDVVSIAGVGTFVTVKGPDCGSQDCVFQIDPSNGKLIKNLGKTGYVNAYGLAFWKGQLYGFTSDGQIFTFDIATSKSTLVSDQSVSFYGAGTTTCAPQQ